MSIGERIRARRKQLGISADELAKKVGVSRSTVFRWEKGEIDKIEAMTLNRVSAALQTTDEYLFGLVDNPDESFGQAPAIHTKDDGKSNNASYVRIKYPETRTLAGGFEKMPDEARDKLMAFVRDFFTEYFPESDEKGQSDDEDNA